MHYILSHWSFDPFVLVVLALVAFHELGLAHLAARGRPERCRARRRRSLLFYAGLGVLLLAVTSPIDYWSNDYFFVHMVEHLLIMFVAPTLVVAGAPWLPLLHALPVAPRRRVLRAVVLGGWSAPLRALGRFLISPWVAVVLFNATMIFWHITPMFDLAYRDGLVHIWLMHGSFFVVGLLFWAQFIDSYPIRTRMAPGARISALLATNVVMWFLAMAMSIFTNSSWYPVYSHLPGVTLSPFASQQIGAAILWICGDFWATPALTRVIRQMIDDEGGLGAAFDRMLHRDRVPTLEDVAS